MQRIVQFLLALLLAPAAMARAQTAAPLDPPQRVFPDTGPGIRALRGGPAGKYYVLTAPGSSVLVFDGAGKKLGQIPAQPTGAAAIVFGAALDVDHAGRVYVADRGGNVVLIYSPEGTLVARVAVAAPVGVAALPDDEFAVCGFNVNPLISVYDFRGTLLRNFGSLAELADDPALNLRLNLGSLAADAAGNLYFAFSYVPDPTVRKYDRFGYLLSEMVLPIPGIEDVSNEARAEIDRAAQGAVVSPHPVISAFTVDAASQELWVAAGDQLVHFDATGRALESARARTPEGARLDPTFLFAEPDRVFVGADPLGIYELTRSGHVSRAP